MSLSVAETAGAAVGAEEFITVGENTYALEAPPIEITTATVAQHSGSLVMARRLDPESGGLLYVPKRHDFQNVPGKMNADEALEHLKNATIQSNTLVPAPPIVGTLHPFNETAFAVHRPDQPTALVPYASPCVPYLTHFVQQVI